MLRVGLDVDADTLDPRLTKNTSGFRMKELAFNGLVAINPDFSPAPDLAEKWDNPDDKTWVFHLRPGVKFHDGSDLTAADVKFTYESVLDQAFNSPFRAFYLSVDKVEATDKNTVTFTLKTPFAPFLSYMDLAILPQAAVQKLGADFGTKPVGTGPFKVDRWATGDTIELSANETYFGGRPNLDRVRVKVVPDNSARVVGLESGDLDFVQSPVSPQDVSRVADGGQAQGRPHAGGRLHVHQPEYGRPDPGRQEGPPGAVAPGQQAADHRHHLQGHRQAGQRADRARHVGLSRPTCRRTTTAPTRPKPCSTRPAGRPARTASGPRTARS